MLDPDISSTQVGVGRGAADPDLPPAPPGYELRAEVGRGGMGVVYRARDLALDREVAVKLLQDRFAPDSPTARRFLDEARITAQLQHPGIPAVYHVGTAPAGRPFLAMKLVKGDTLDRRLKAAEPLDRLGVFAAVCQAVGYAHARRVIHRDLKPANVMVGAFAEVQVMDWGLAKVLRASSREAEPSGPDPEAAAGTEIRPAPESDGSATQHGSMLGTPAYMPPEQAAGELDKIDERSDVFGLGAVLCVLLTGRPVYEADAPEAIRVMALRGKTEAAFARLDACGADPGLVALCKRCLAFEPADRPADGHAVAAAVTALRAAADERARQAERDRLAAAVRAAEEHKRRRTARRYTAAGAAVLLAGVAGTTFGFVREADQRAKAEQATADLAAVNAEIVATAEKAVNEADAGRRQAAAARLQALVARTDADTPDGRREKARRLFQQADLTGPADPAAALAALGQAVELFRGLAAADPSDRAARHGLVIGLVRASRLLADARRADEAAARLAEADAQAERFAADFPDDPDAQRVRFTVANDAGHLARTRGDLTAARRHFELARQQTELHARRRPDAPEVAHDLSVCHENLGLLAAAVGDAAEAVRQIGRAVELRELEAARRPADLRAQEQLLIGYRTQVEVLADTGDPAAAEAIGRRALALNLKLTPPDRAAPHQLDQLSIWLNRLGNLAQQQFGRTAGRAEFEEMARLNELSLRQKPDSLLTRRSLGIASNALGRIMQASGDSAGALAAFARTRAIVDEQVRQFPTDPLLLDDLGVTRMLAGRLLTDLGRWDEAAAELTAAHAAFERVRAGNPESVPAAVRVAQGCGNLGELELARERFAPAADWFGRATAVLEPLDAAGKLAASQAGRETLAENRQLRAEAEAAARATADLTWALAQPPDVVPRLLARRGLALARRGDRAGAAETAAALAGLRPPAAGNRYDAACILAQLKDAGEAERAAAVAHLRAAAAAGYRDLRHIETDPDLDPLRDREDFRSVMRLLAREPAPPPRRGRP